MSALPSALPSAPPAAAAAPGAPAAAPAATPSQPPGATPPPWAGLRLEHTYARELPGCSVPGRPDRAPAPRLLFLNRALAAELGLDADPLGGEAGAELFAGNRLPEGCEPVAQAYAGHQFGGFSPQLGDGRALLLGEQVDRAGRRRDIAFKGSGRTPFSRGGDGKAAVGPMLREALLGEAMHALGIPTTRALAVTATGEPVLRDRMLPGAVLTRVADSHLRVGTFQFFAARGDRERLARVAAYAIARHDPALQAVADARERHLAFLGAVLERQAALVARWMGVGFLHGVMNTDNTTISGETIDYGPCAFLEAYDPQAVFSSIDHGGRYAFGNQPPILLWNLARLAEALLPLVADDPHDGVAPVTAVLDTFPARYRAHLLAGQRRKLGLQRDDATFDDTLDDEDAALADDWLALLQAQRVDFTQAWRALSDAAAAPAAAAAGAPGGSAPSAAPAAPLSTLFADPAALAAWLARWQARCAKDDGGPATPERAAARAARMRAVNPRIVPRNHLVEEALAAASDHGDLAPFEALLAAVGRPFDDDPALARYAQPAPAEVTACYRTFCGT
ncbi:MAG: protein adenylyltransferase SelO [Pseudomonadota bacterium]|nr:YdiU family protein [Rubrivivax sp.]